MQSDGPKSHGSNCFEIKAAKLGIFPGDALSPFIDLGSSGEKKLTQNIILGRGPTQKHHQYKYGRKALIIVQKLQSDGNSV